MAMKLTKRKGFNFFRSYYDVYNELSDKDKILFIDALLDRQFLGIKPDNLTGMAKFAYISQTNSIDSQVKGFEDKTGIILNPTEPPAYGGHVPPTVQVEGKGEVKEEGEVKEQGVKTKIYGTEKDFFQVDSKYLHDNKYIIHKDGFKEFIDAQRLMWFPKEYHETLFWKDWNGKLFNDTKHLNTVMINIINNKNG